MNARTSDVAITVFSQWDQIFQSPMATAAAIDRIVHHSVILEFDVPSYRTDQAKRKTGGTLEPKSEGKTKRKKSNADLNYTNTVFSQSHCNFLGVFAPPGKGGNPRGHRAYSFYPAESPPCIMAPGRRVPARKSILGCGSGSRLNLGNRVVSGGEKRWVSLETRDVCGL